MINSKHIKRSIRRFIRKFNKDKKFRTNTTIGLILIVIVFAFSFNILTHMPTELSSKGLKLLNEYEVPKSKIEANDNVTCMKPYDINDGKVTFGAGITYNSIEEGLKDINQEFKTKYTINNNCIDIKYLKKLEIIKLKTYEKYVLKVKDNNNLRLNQQQFDALVIMAFNSPNVLKDDDVLQVLVKKESKSKYINSMDNYYKTLSAYYDNPNTKEMDDGFGEGWLNRIKDSADVYYNHQYKFQS
ncbi:MAG: glycoside hydrolase family protein [Mycoplasmatales bacterium]